MGGRMTRGSCGGSVEEAHCSLYGPGGGDDVALQAGQNRRRPHQREAIDSHQVSQSVSQPASQPVSSPTDVVTVATSTGHLLALCAASPGLQPEHHSALPGGSRLRPPLPPAGGGLARSRPPPPAAAPARAPATACPSRAVHRHVMPPVYQPSTACEGLWMLHTPEW